MNLGCRDAHQPRRLTGMRRDYAVGRQAYTACGQLVQGIGIPDLRLLGVGGNRQQAFAPGRCAQAGTDNDHRDFFQQPHQLVGRTHADGHHLRQARQCGWHVLRASRQRDHAGATAQSAFSTQQRSTAKAMVAADDQQVAELAFMGVRGTCSQLRQMAVQQRLYVGNCVFCLRHASSSSDVWQNYTHLTCGFPCLMPAITSDLPALAQSIKDWGRELGFQQVGISGLDLAEHELHLQRWLDAGYHGEMDYMGAHGSKRSHPEELVPGTLRVVSLRMDYLPGDTQMAQLLAKPDKAYISRYALGRDYHKLIRKRVQQLADRIQAQIGPFGFRAFVDSAPVLEKAIAEQAGLGWIGKNTLVLNRKAGSYFFLSELFVDLPLPVDAPHATEHCGRCTACLDICPTNAFVGPYVLDARRCISYLTIELKSAIPEDLRPLIGNRVFGCDDCQIVCPWNRFARSTAESDFKPRHNLDNAELAELFMWDEDKFLSSTEGSPLRRAGYERWLRNLAVGLGNAPSSIPVLEALKARRDYPSELVREHVEWALNQHATR
ncbi:hypothetical protein ALP97_05015 [Pseudomonas salomonii]|uniref:Epoxyqueuosine reductase n=3 Tax=Gammaproteobacteria TaxID=1236 RepID=A0A3M4QG02_9PSED|nr:hypothetical protein ALP97_05015 [Pseudomonas salomonii]